TDGYQDKIVAIDPKSNLNVKEIKTELGPFDAISIEKEGRELIILSHASNKGIWVIDPLTYKTIKQMPLPHKGDEPAGYFHLAYNPVYNKLYAVSRTLQELYVFDSKEWRHIKTIKTGDMPSGIAVSPDGRYVYVTNMASKNISVVNSADDKIERTIPFNGLPNAITLSPDGKYLYVTDEENFKLFIIESSANKTIKELLIGIAPRGITATSDGKYIYVSNLDSFSVTAVDVNKMEIIANIPVSSLPWGIASSPDSKRVFVCNCRYILFFILLSLCLVEYAEAKEYLYVTHERRNIISVIDIKEKKVIKKIPIGKTPTDIALYPEKKLIAISHKDELSEFIWIIDSATYKTKQKTMSAITRHRERGRSYIQFSSDYTKLYSIDDENNHLEIFNIKDWKPIKKVVLDLKPMGITFSPANKEAYIPTLYKGGIHILDLENDAIKDNIIIDGAASDIAVSSDGKIAYISDIVNSNVIIMELKTRKILKRIIVGNRPHRVLLSKDEKLLYVANYHSNNISVIDTERMDAIALIPAGILPYDMALSKDGRWLFSSNYDESSISIIDTKTNKVTEKILVEIYPTRIKLGSF
ncbi:MAG: beta-propeller fold lactonase family protein, partial [Nitrospirae bacterium]|nr:beta-propeller fold lactonase family protein [Nitrospirota bacterium]